MSEVFTIIAPTHIMLPRKKVDDKKIGISLNWYRNAHHQIANEAKKTFKELLEKQIKALPVMERVRLEFWYHSATKRSADIDNWCSISCKFFQDALVEYGRVQDDSYNFIRPVVMDYGGLSRRKKGFVKILIEEVV